MNRQLVRYVSTHGASSRRVGTRNSDSAKNSYRPMPTSRSSTRREQTAEPTGPELDQADPPVPVVLVEQQGRDQEPAQGEEHVDAEEAAGHPPDAVVVQHDGHDGDGTEAVEARSVAPRALAGPASAGPSVASGSSPRDVTNPPTTDIRGSTADSARPIPTSGRSADRYRHRRGCPRRHRRLARRPRRRRGRRRRRSSDRRTHGPGLRPGVGHEAAQRLRRARRHRGGHPRPRRARRSARIDGPAPPRPRVRPGLRHRRARRPGAQADLLEHRVRGARRPPRGASRHGVRPVRPRGRHRAARHGRHGPR